jgi:hypothetical protein
MYIIDDVQNLGIQTIRENLPQNALVQILQSWCKYGTDFPDSFQIWKCPEK